jgi:hypothetical protein
MNRGFRWVVLLVMCVPDSKNWLFLYLDDAMGCVRCSTTEGRGSEYVLGNTGMRGSHAPEGASAPIHAKRPNTP